MVERVALDHKTKVRFLEGLPLGDIMKKKSKYKGQLKLLLVRLILLLLLIWMVVIQIGLLEQSQVVQS
jgi:hypothetical protein